MSHEQCIEESPIKRRLTDPPLRNPNEYITAPQDALQIELVPELLPSTGYEKIVTAMSVFSRYLIAYPTSYDDTNAISEF